MYAVAASGIALLAPFGSVDKKFLDLHFNANVKGFFLIDKEGIIRAADVNADYTVRADRAEIVRQLRTLAKTVQK